MKIKLLLSIFLLQLVSSCDPSELLYKSESLDGSWTVGDVSTPDYIFPQELPTNDINISFSAEMTYHVNLSENSCGGSYKLADNGNISLFDSNCRVGCCSTKWDHYILTLLRKVNSFEQKGSTLILQLDSENSISLIK